MSLRRFCVFCAVLALLPTPGGAEDTDPPLEGILLYSRLTDGTWQLWQTDVMTGERRQLTSSPGDKRFPAMSLDGWIVYHTSNRTSYRRHRLDGPEEPFLSDLWPVRDLSWSPNGQYVAFSKFHTELIDSANLWIANRDGTHPRLITREAGLQYNAAWSPDGTHIAYAAGQGMATYELYVIQADGTGQRRLTTNQSNEFLPAWSPDGARIAYTSDASGDYEVWVAQADGSSAIPLTRSPGLDTAPTWSPDGRWIAFATNRSGELEIWVMSAEGSGQRLLERAEGGACDPSWR
jgi:TolB protein